MIPPHPPHGLILLLRIVHNAICTGSRNIHVNPPDRINIFGIFNGFFSEVLCPLLPFSLLLHLPIQLLIPGYKVFLSYYPLLEQQMSQYLNLKHIGDGQFLYGDDFFWVEWCCNQSVPLFVGAGQLT